MTDEAKTDLDFDYFDPIMSENHSLNDTTRMKTDAAIRKHFRHHRGFSFDVDGITARFTIFH